MQNVSNDDSTLVVPEDKSRLVTLSSDTRDQDFQLVINALKNASVVLVRNLKDNAADQLMLRIAESFALKEQLQLQAALADSLGHRKLMSKFYMTVNERRDFQFVTPHSEGSQFVGVQLASFYSYENTTDGGETILFNVKQDAEAWSSLRELCVRGQVSGHTILTRGQIAQIRVVHKLNMPDDALRADDRVLREYDGAVPGLRLFDVLAKPRKTHCRILQVERYGYWDSRS